MNAWAFHSQVFFLSHKFRIHQELDKTPGIVVQASACPKCGHRLAPWENLPLLSFVLLRGRCRGCGTAISWQYPAVELLTGVLFALVVWRFGMTSQALAALTFTAFLVAMSGIDLRTTLLPDDLTLPLLWSLLPYFSLSHPSKRRHRKRRQARPLPPRRSHRPATPVRSRQQRCRPTRRS